MLEVKSNPELELAQHIGSFYSDPLGFVMFAYPWGQSGPLQHFKGPREWQREFLYDWGNQIKERNFDGHTPVMPIRTSTLSGHGSGKSALSAFVTDFIMSTRPHCKGIVTANTSTQLETKTWAEISKWSKRLINAHWFKITTGRGAMKMVHVDHPDTWFTSGIAWRENATEAFAGQHAVDSTSFYLYDEASGIPNTIFETGKGGLTDGEPMEFLFGNGTRNSGYFYDTHNSLKHRYTTRQIDSRDVEGTNRSYFEEMIEDYGLDSDIVKVRVRGMFPSQSAQQFISADVYDMAVKRELPEIDMFQPIVLGVDVARFGDDETVIWTRQGNDARSIEPIRLGKLRTTEVANLVFEHALKHQADAVFVDGGGVGGGVVDDLIRMRCPNVIEVNAQNKSSIRDYRDKAAECWGSLRNAAARGLCLPQMDSLREQILAREYYYDGNDAIMLESKKALKKRGEPSPDLADALALTFAYPVPQRTMKSLWGHLTGQQQSNVVGVDYDPMEQAYD